MGNYLAIGGLAAVALGLMSIWFAIAGRRPTAPAIEETSEKSKDMGPGERLLWAVLGVAMAVDGVALLLHDLFKQTRWSVTLLGALILCMIAVLKFSPRSKADREAEKELEDLE